MIESTKPVERIQPDGHSPSIFCFSFFLYLESNGEDNIRAARAYLIAHKYSFFL